MNHDERAGTIAELAHRFWEERGRPDGTSEEDWYKAESIVDEEQDREGGTETPRTVHQARPEKKRKRGKLCHKQ